MILSKNPKPMFDWKKSIISTLLNWTIVRRLVIIYNVLLHISKLEYIWFWPSIKFDNIKIFLFYNYSFQCMTIVQIIGIYAWSMLKIILSKFWIHCNQEVGMSFDITVWKQWYAFKLCFFLLLCIGTIINTLKMNQVEFFQIFFKLVDIRKNFFQFSIDWLPSVPTQDN